jgi:hypothetical protein
MPTPPSVSVDLLRPVELIQEHLSTTLCDEVWGEVRTNERRRRWFLDSMAKFWVAVVLWAPASLRQALSSGIGRRLGDSPPDTSEQAFFLRSQGLRVEFFARLFEAFRSRLVAIAPRNFAHSLAPLFERFGAVHVLDGSRLDAVRRRLKMLWRDRRVPLPGMVVALYDLATGTMARLAFDARAKASEFRVATTLLSSVPANSLLVGDRLFGVVAWFDALSLRGLFGVARRFGPVGIQVQEQLGRHPLDSGEVIEESLVLAGSPRRRERSPRILRRIRLLRGNRTLLDLLTNVLDPARLSASEALELYRHRWSVERLFSDLKDVLYLKHFYGANTNAVAQQVYAAAIVHTAMRVAQGLVAEEVDVEPERLSTGKLFPRLAIASCEHITCEQAFLAVQQANVGVALIKPDWRAMPFAHVDLRKILVEPRTRRRKERPRRPAIPAWRDLPSPRNQDH